MTTALQRVARMRYAFAKNKSILAEDYEYFITPRESTPRVKLRVSRRNGMSGDPQNGVKRRHRIEAAIEPEHIFVQVGL
jgi:hypothetical protein